MDVRPIEEVWLRPVLTLLVCAALPYLVFRGARALAGIGGLEDARATLRWVTPAFVFFAAVTGATALGPTITQQEDSWFNLAFGVASVLVILRARGGLVAVPFPHFAGVMSTCGVALLVTLLIESLRPAWLFMSVTATLASLVVTVLGAPRIRALLALTALGVSAMIVVTLAVLPVMTEIQPEHIPTAGTDAAHWRLRVHPWDADAMLTAAWGARSRDELRRAAAQARTAERMGTNRAGGLELEAELLAADGDCEGARDRFDEAIQARAVEALEGALDVRLELGGYRLPPTMVEECGPY